MRNGTAQTFDASSGFTVRFPGNPTLFPDPDREREMEAGAGLRLLRPDQEVLSAAVPGTSGFQFNLGGARSIAIPGPSGIFLRLKYNPATFDRILDSIVAFGPGRRGGTGIKYGMPDTAINAFVSAKTTATISAATSNRSWLDRPDRRSAITAGDPCLERIEEPRYGARSSCEGSRPAIGPPSLLHRGRLATRGP